MSTRTKVLTPTLVALGVAALVGAGGVLAQPSSASAPTTAPAASPEVDTSVVNATCPVMGGPINPDIHVDYQGKRVYFCCATCPGVFQRNPERYLSQLPQFNPEAAAGQASGEAHESHSGHEHGEHHEGMQHGMMNPQGDTTHSGAHSH